MYADYVFYTATYGGNVIAQADFPRLSARASDFIDYYTRNKAAKVDDADTDTQTALGKACCAVAEAIKRSEDADALADKATSTALAGNGELKSESVGSYSVSFVTSADYDSKRGAAGVIDRRQMYAAVAQEYLAHTGLLYRGC